MKGHHKREDVTTSAVILLVYHMAGPCRPVTQIVADVIPMMGSPSATCHSSPRLRWSHRVAVFGRTQPWRKGCGLRNTRRAPRTTFNPLSSCLPPATVYRVVHKSLQISAGPTCSFLLTYTSEPYPTKSSRPQFPWNIRQPFLHTKLNV